MRAGGREGFEERFEKEGYSLGGGNLVWYVVEQLLQVYGLGD
jgi:hypothetical protein